jgi:hypothetical protein
VIPPVPYTALAGLAFLLEHPTTGRHVLFDVGMHKDIDNLALAVKVEFAKADGSLSFMAEHGVPDQLVVSLNVSMVGMLYI